VSSRSFGRILVANRGEIALRIMRTAKKLGYRTVAVYSEADRSAPHVEFADDAVLLGPAPVQESYLNVARVLDAADRSGADAVHPGYGFLSENAAFARACEAADLVFIGPPSDAIELMGNKAAAKRKMIEAGVPCVPGFEDRDATDQDLIVAADRIGFPVMVKAAAGGGGRGMRLVAEAAALPAALGLARSEARNAFGSGELILEKAIVRPRHVEVQVFADAHGGVIHLGERDCSVQRRHQKVVEEAPCPVMTSELRERMGAAAVEAARSIGYRGAGTVEFLLDEQGAFYFLEMNTRLQVEHPVTECVTGLDLVELQIRVARGEPLEVTQADVPLNGHAIEVRLYAEDPSQDFLPGTGMIDLWRPPMGEGVRVDAGVESGQAITPFYDPMIAKIIAWGRSREDARKRLVAALEHTVLFGPRSNRDFLIAVLSRPAFVRGEATTAFIAEQFSDRGLGDDEPTFEQAAMAAVLQNVSEHAAAAAATCSSSVPLKNWCSAGTLASRYGYLAGGAAFDLFVRPRSATCYEVSDGDRSVVVETSAQGSEELMVDGRKHFVCSQVPEAGRIHVADGARTYTLRNRYASAEAGHDPAGEGSVVAPMHGVLLEISAVEGQEVRRGDRLVVLEAMKMQHEIAAAVDGVIREIRRSVGEQVAADDLLIEIEVATS